MTRMREVLVRPAPPVPAEAPIVDIRVGMTLAAAERALIEATLSHVGGVRTEAARLLGIHVQTLHWKLRAYRDIDRRLSEPRS